MWACGLKPCDKIQKRLGQKKKFGMGGSGLLEGEKVSVKWVGVGCWKVRRSLLNVNHEV